MLRGRKQYNSGQCCPLCVLRALQRETSCASEWYIGQLLKMEPIKGPQPDLRRSSQCRSRVAGRLPQTDRTMIESRRGQNTPRAGREGSSMPCASAQCLATPPLLARRRQAPRKLRHQPRYRQCIGRRSGRRSADQVRRSSTGGPPGAVVKTMLATIGNSRRATGRDGDSSGVDVAPTSAGEYCRSLLPMLRPASLLPSAVVVAETPAASWGAIGVPHSAGSGTGARVARGRRRCWDGRCSPKGPLAPPDRIVIACSCARSSIACCCSIAISCSRRTR
mmetsp:Transcript_19047/g.38472  ORF Transcript_19047/g.38472 Transcript_19047/m.38472 type:complete len:278 (-) Transcript_19047:134-967(-)